MKKITGRYGASEIEIIVGENEITVFVWDKWTLSTPIGRHTLPKTKVKTIEVAKDLAVSSIAEERNTDINAVRRSIEWDEEN